MTDAVHRLIEEPVGGGTIRLRLPGRSSLGLPGVRLVVWVFSLMGLVVAAVGLWFVCTGQGTSRLFGLPFAVAGVAIVVVARMLGASHAVIVVTATSVERIERLGLLRFRRSLLRDRIARIAIMEMAVRVNGRPVRGIGQLTFYDAGGAKPLMGAAFYYPNEVLAELAQRVSVAVGLEEPVAVERDHREVEPDIPVDAPPPASSSMTIERNAAGLMVHVPKLGWKGLPLLLAVFGGVFVVFPTAIGTAIIGSGPESTMAMVAFVGLFILVGLLILGWGIVMAGRRAILAVVQGSLVVRRVRPFLGVKVYEWPAGAVSDIRVTDSSTSVNDRPLRQISIFGAGQNLALLVGRGEGELQWLAATLRGGLGITRDGGGDVASAAETS